MTNFHDMSEEEENEIIKETAKNRVKEEKADLRDNIAIRAMQAICTNSGRNGFHFRDKDNIARTAYSMADAMIEARGLK